MAFFGFNKKRRGKIRVETDITPDEIFLDSSNISGFDQDQFEGRIEKSISTKTFVAVGIIFGLIGLMFTIRIWSLQIIQGKEFAERSERNSIRQSIVFADRGIIYDVHNRPLAWNESASIDDEQLGRDEFSHRKYIDSPGFSNLLGYVKYPKKDSAGFYFDEDVTGVDGIEFTYNELLAGENGSEIIETDALNKVVEEGTTKKPETGNDLHLTIDADIQENLQKSVARVVTENDFTGGGGVIMDIFTGDILSIVTYPEYDSNVLSSGLDNSAIAEYVNDPANPFLNRVTEGLYAPGSIVKPFMAITALDTGVIDQYKKILSTKEMVVPNPYNPDKPSIFTDWKAHGYVNIREAIAYSSNVYFYQVGGGFGDQEGIGINRINEYLRKFGFGEAINSTDFPAVSGVVPNPEWKKETFDGDDWRLGDTYFTSIGQYGFQVTPLQIVTAYSALANNGTVVEPRLVSESTSNANTRRQIDIDQEYFDIVKAGMRDVITIGVAKSLSFDDLHIAGKTGTAELGVTKANVNSWMTGFFPYENPRYAFAIFLERGSRLNTAGSVTVARLFFNWLIENKPEYTK